MTIDAFGIHAEGGAMNTFPEISSDRSGEAALPHPAVAVRRQWVGHVVAAVAFAEGGEQTVDLRHVDRSFSN